MEDFRGLYPHLENCVQVIEGDDGIALRLLIDTNKHLYLNNHIFGGKCFVPATVIMELLMEAALWYTRKVLNKNVFFPIGLIDFNIERALAIAQGHSMEAIIDFQSVAEIDGQLVISLNIHSERRSTTGEKVGVRVNTTVKVLLADNYPLGRNIEIPRFFKEQFSIPQDVYYSYYFSLGYLFNSCTGKIAFDKEEKVFLGVYDCLGKEAQFIKDNNSPFLSSPLGNDSCLQYAVFFSRILFLKSRLPIGGKEFLMLKKHPLTGPVRVLIKCLHIDDDVMVFDFDSFDDKSLIASGKEFKVKKSPYHTGAPGEEFYDVLYKYREVVQ